MKKILIAEDDVFLQKVFEAKMKKVGYEIRIATDGEEVAAILAEFTPDLIVLDLILPKKNGFEILKELKGSSKWKDIPVIVTTNLSQPEDKERVRALGASEYIVKSDTPIALMIEKIQALL